MLRNAVFLCVFPLFANCVFGKTLRNALLLDAKLEFQRSPWLTVDIKKSSSTKGSYNFKFNFHVWRNTKGATLDFYKWPLLPTEGNLYNMSTTAGLCEAIKEDYFKLFATGNLSKACESNGNVLSKGNYWFEYNVDDASFTSNKEIGTAVYYCEVNHGGATLLALKFLVDTSIMATRQYKDPEEQTTLEPDLQTPAPQLPQNLMELQPPQMVLLLERAIAQEPQELYPDVATNFL